MRVKDAVGRFGEDVAVEFLRRAGVVVLERNWRCPEGEIDIVGHDGAELVIVEVKTRSSGSYGSPAEAVDHAKAARLRRLAIRWIEAHRGDPAVPEWSSVRIDVIAVVRSRRGGGPQIDHFVGAV